eukprot:666996-Prorocentrum_minimum.AAC.1
MLITFRSSAASPAWALLALTAVLHISRLVIFFSTACEFAAREGGITLRGGGFAIRRGGGIANSRPEGAESRIRGPKGVESRIQIPR